MTGQCKDCRRWDNGVCTAFDQYDTPEPDGAAHFATASDDTGLRSELRTGPEFGCIKFECKPPNDDTDDSEDEPASYRIVRRYRQPPESEVIYEGFTLLQAQEHCKDPSTHGVDWMDTYEKE